MIWDDHLKAPQVGLNGQFGSAAGRPNLTAERKE